jgi:hypothetical protein
MSTSAKWTVGIIIGLVVLVALPFALQAIFPSPGYGMMDYGRMPMMGRGGYAPFHGGMPFGMLFIWLIPHGLLVLIALGIAALIKYLTTKTG